MCSGAYMDVYAVLDVLDSFKKLTIPSVSQIKFSVYFIPKLSWRHEPSVNPLSIEYNLFFYDYNNGNNVFQMY